MRQPSRRNVDDAHRAESVSRRRQQRRSGVKADLRILSDQRVLGKAWIGSRIGNDEQLRRLKNADAKTNTALIGKICADQITPYPPGIPVLVPGQEIGKEVLDYLRSILLSQRHIEVHGLIYRQELPHLRIATIIRGQST